MAVGLWRIGHPALPCGNCKRNGMTCIDSIDDWHFHVSRLSLRSCFLTNPDDEMAERGPGPVLLEP